MRYSLLISAGPSQRAGLTALHTARALLARGHTLSRVFFYRHGVHLASRLAASANGDAAAIGWQSLVIEHRLPATVCVGAALRRGVVDHGEADRLSLDGNNLADGFILGGLGDWADALSHSDRVLCFGR